MTRASPYDGQRSNVPSSLVGHFLLYTDVYSNYFAREVGIARLTAYEAFCGEPQNMKHFVFCTQKYEAFCGEPQNMKRSLTASFRHSAERGAVTRDCLFCLLN